MAIYELDGVQPRLGVGAWVAETAQVIGDVSMGEGSSVWFGAVVRGDNSTITLGNGSNVQDLSCLHSDFGKPLTIGKNVTIGHQVMLHGCTIGDDSLIGIGAIILNDAIIGKGCLVGAGALVTERSIFPDGSVIFGSPAKAVRQITPEQLQGLKNIAPGYVKNAARFGAGLKKILD